MKYTIETLANKITGKFNFEANGFKLNDSEIVFDDRICFVSGILENGEATLYDVVHSLENEETFEMNTTELILLENLINQQL